VGGEKIGGNCRHSREILWTILIFVQLEKGWMGEKVEERAWGKGVVMDCVYFKGHVVKVVRKWKRE
jgi:hypothetical protein